MFVFGDALNQVFLKSLKFGALLKGTSAELCVLVGPQATCPMPVLSCEAWTALRRTLIVLIS